jgi:hypothetical protein
VPFWAVDLFVDLGQLTTMRFVLADSSGYAETQVPQAWLPAQPQAFQFLFLGWSGCGPHVAQSASQALGF